MKYKMVVKSLSRWLRIIDSFAIFFCCCESFFAFLLSTLCVCVIFSRLFLFFALSCFSRVGSCVKYRAKRFNSIMYDGCRRASCVLLYGAGCMFSLSALLLACLLHLSLALFLYLSPSLSVFHYSFTERLASL